MSTPVMVGGRLLGWDDRRGTGGMWLFMATEALLFVSLFFSYFYLGRAKPRWPPEPPKLHFALPMLALLLASSVVLHWGEGALRLGRRAAARVALAATLILGATFLALQGLEYTEHLRTLRPTTSAYGSIFYAITGVHGAHVLLGMLMLSFVGLLPALEPRHHSPHRPLHNAALYWHFVDLVWVAIVVLLYLLPNVRR